VGRGDDTHEANEGEIMSTLEDRPHTRTWLTRRRVVIAAVLAAIVAAVGLLWFQPQKLFIDDTVNEAAPSVSDARSDSMGDKMVADANLMKMASLEGTFSSLAHDTSGEATLKELEDGSHVLRLEDFETSNGPDVRVYLSAGDKDSYGKDFVDLGGLKGNVGDQNYTVPSGTDLDRYDTVVIWCRRFTVAFGAALLA
jgi:hypothetical protein